MKNKEFENWALKKLEKIQKVLLLEDYYPITISFKEDKTATAQAKFNYPYKSIDIFYSQGLLDNYVEKKYSFIIGVLIHEMVHSLTDPLYDCGYQRFLAKDQLENEREKLTDHIANIILKNKLI
ncbi:MAG: hypothetical protein H6743_03830 [Rickettsiaceae bacterium]|nr:hypothetical protein [Rickettsiaceae bacterium]